MTSRYQPTVSSSSRLPAPSDHAEDPESLSFADLGVSQAIVEALESRGIVHPFPIQALTLPVALRGNDIIGQAKTGTGKTLGFGIPLLMDTLGPGEEGWDEDPGGTGGAADEIAERGRSAQGSEQ